MIPAPPFAEDLALGVPLPLAPDVTVDAGLAAAYVAVTGDGLRPALSDRLSHALTGRAERLANPALVLSVSIGQSTVATRRVIANLQYRDLVLRDAVHLGDTLRTTVTPLAADWTRSGRERAKVLLGMRLTRDDEVVADYQRLALLPVREPDRLDATGIPEAAAPAALADHARWIPAGWRGADATHDLRAGETWEDPLADTVSSARELVRLTHNLAATHRDGRTGPAGGRLVYGGHTVGLAQASLSRTLPDLLTVVAWRSCDHLAPVFEEDLITVRTRIDGVAAADGFRFADATVTATAHRPDGPVDVLDWHPVLVLADGVR
jgi:acyl dehydratase